MPLLIQNVSLERVTSTAELFAKYPHLQENAKVFRSQPLTDVDPKCLLYVQQREFAVTTPADNSVSVIGSEDATTCHLVVLRHTGSGAACLAHCDGSNTCAEVSLFIKSVTSLSSCCNDGRLELHLVGGFNDEAMTSHELSLNILGAFHQLKDDIHLETCCITEMNDVVINAVHRPAVYGVGVNVKTGKVFPAAFPCKGPAEDLRSARTFTGGQMVDIYDFSRELVQVGPCKWSPNMEIAFWLAQDDAIILKYLSTSPNAEPPHFVRHIKSTIQFLLKHPNADDLFPGGQPQLYHRTESGDWDRVTIQVES
ncbi:protein N-terminal asparagine amidohydrolase [Corythoichthys intestinalis]|uniref:protein N-terminal asparagine amidohydrolase n=1 Tax=Corythoichthys intestinalis TaxID=161448 RepID=UPI0025A61EC2|nr:protein N-terminal asparagine amidohydrolase [Corythoichthys intestinalis]